MKRILGMAVIAACASMSTNVRAEGHWVHFQNLDEFFIIQGTNDTVDHSWGESNGTNPMNQMTQDWPKFSQGCVTYTNTSNCSNEREWYDWQSSTSESITTYIRDLDRTCYLNTSPGSYAYNGVCHQASNRAFNHTNMPWLNNLVYSAIATYGIFHYCGTTWPWGNWNSCGC